MRIPLGRSSAIALALTASIAVAPTTASAQADESLKKGTIQISYEAPKDPALQDTHDMVRKDNALEMLRRVFLSFRLPEDLHIKAVSCDGIPNAYFSRENDKPTIRICYEYLKYLRAALPRETTPRGATRTEALMGQFLFAAAHEFGHAVFDLYNLPLLGRQEDAADQFATYFLLQFGGERAHRLILGAAFAYHQMVTNDKDKHRVTLPVAAFSSDHGTAEQRFYNLACIAYGYDPKLFADIIERGDLPEGRAKFCKFEYSDLAHAIKTLINPHLDGELAETVMAISWFTPPEARAPDDWIP
jgi:hypothetical protein